MDFKTEVWQENTSLYWTEHRLKTAWTSEMPHSDSNLPIAPVLVSLHSMTVIQCDRAAVWNGIEAELPGVKWLSRADVFSPTEGEELENELGNRMTYY